MTNTHTKILLVEGAEDKRIIPELMEANGITWDKNSHPVDIIDVGGVEKMVKESTLQTYIKARNPKILGIMADANSDAGSRWKSISRHFVEHFPDLPEELPQTGLVRKNDASFVFGVWLMPDNQSHGMIETFLTYLVPKGDTDPVLKFAEHACKDAKANGAPYKEPHAEKAKIYTWLAWQDPPGRQLHDAVKQRILDPNSPYAANFVKWFRELFEV